MRIFIASDHAGFELKSQIIEHLRANGHEVEDIGPAQYDPNDDYPGPCIACGQAVVQNPGSLGVVIGGSGNGEQIAANLVDGVRCALAWNLVTARLARQHNNANVVSVGARMHPADQAIEIVDAFIAEPFSNEERHIRRINEMADYEKRRCEG
ncbi:MAG: ribose-5-phosphate isomerase [Actinomycetaceae bacterium]|mgnify:CR=1 FL=1|nr:ribose-5-phosphate isomerase [Actinomycetaceae bacterium]MDU0969674.1 ribose-5-phosphate isomerase [Actinomycetaceae bacterium]